MGIYFSFEGLLLKSKSRKAGGSAASLVAQGRFAFGTHCFEEKGPAGPDYS